MSYRPRRMKFGVFLAPFHRMGENPTLALKRDMELIEQLDELGYDEAWIGEPIQVAWRDGDGARVARRDPLHDAVAVVLTFGENEENAEMERFQWNLVSHRGVLYNA